MKTHFKIKIWVIGGLFLFLGASVTCSSANLMWSDNFDTYDNGQFLDGGGDDGGWKGWGNVPSSGAYVTNTQSHTSPNSVEITGTVDLVHEYEGYTSGASPYRCLQYIPANFTGSSYFILLSEYFDGGSGNIWAVQLRFDSDLDVVESEFTGEQLPLIYDTWVEIICDVNLDTDWLRIYYNGALLSEHAWTDTVQGTGGGTQNVAAVDLFANGASAVYYDDMWFPYWYEPLMCDAGGPYSGETGKAIQFNGSARFGTQPYTWAWDFGDGATTSVQNPTHAYTTAGVYTVTLTVTDAASTVVTDTTTANITEPQEEPEIVIDSIAGGFGVKAVIKNIGTGDATGVAWEIALDGKMVFVGKSKTGTVDVAAGESVTVKSFVLGFGVTNINVTAADAAKTAAGKVILFFVLGVA